MQNPHLAWPDKITTEATHPKSFCYAHSMPVNSLQEMSPFSLPPAMNKVI